jgi:glycosyltransferase involved in cell wall biosynthesis
LKLLYILPEYLPDSGGGIITFYGQLLPALVKAGHEVRVMVANHPNIDQPECEIDGVQVEYLSSKFIDAARIGCGRFQNLPTFWAFLPLAWGAYQQVKGGEGFDIVEATDWLMLYMPWVVSSRKAKVVVSLHGSNGQVDWYSNPHERNFDSDLVRVMETATLGLADAIHANSRSNARFWEAKINKPIQVIPPVLELPDRANEDKSSPRGLVVGRLQNWKGAEVLCQALEEISDIEIDWVGSDTAWNSSSSASEYLQKNYPNTFGSKLIWNGALNYAETIKIIHQAAFVLVPSIWDVFNMTAAEAMSLRSVVICSRGAGAEMLITDGLNGFLFDSAKPSQLADCIRKVSRLSLQQKEQMGRNARDSVFNALSKSEILKKLHNSYEKILVTDLKSLDEWLLNCIRPEFVEKENSNSNGAFPRIVKKIERIIRHGR